MTFYTERIDWGYFWTAFLCVLLGAHVASAQTIDRDMTLVEPTTSVGGQPLTNLKDCIVDVVDSSGTADSRTLPASSPNGGGTQTIDLTAKIGFTTVTARCRDTLNQEGGSVSLSRIFPGDPPASPQIRP